MNRNSFPFWFLFDQRGGAAVEAALMLPLLMAAGLLCVDLFKIGIERTRMEQAAGSAAITLSVQQTLGKAGLDGLYDALFDADGLQDVRSRHQMVITNVTMPSRRIWWRLSKGADGLCEQAQQDGTYDGPLPTDAGAPGNGDPEADTASFIVVQLCRTVDDISMASLVLPDRLNVQSINRSLVVRVELDAALLAQATGAIVQEQKD